MVAKKTINLALQGGGSHGAFAWGVLGRDRGEAFLEAHYEKLGTESSLDVAERFL
jgi:predicted acylesterase/phospholipase RssA